MFHSGAQTLIDLWNGLPEARRIPARADFDPMAIGGMAGQLFTADRTDQGARIRLAGEWIERAHGQPLRGVEWLSLWNEDGRALVAASIVQAFREGRPVVLVGEAEGLSGVVEIPLTPLRGPDGRADRLLGLYQPVASTDRNARDVGLFSARLSIGVGPVARAPLSLAAVDGRRIA